MSGDRSAPVQRPWADTVTQLTAGLQHAGHCLTAQGAYGWMFRARLNDARSVLAHMPIEALRQVSASATALAALADEVAAGKHR